MNLATRKKLGQILLEYNYITEEQLALAMEKQKVLNKKLGQILTELGFVSNERLSRALEAQRGKLFQESPEVPPLLKTKKLGEILLAEHLITPEQLAKGLEEQKKATNKKMGEIFTDLGFITEEKLAWVLSTQLGVPYTDLNSVVVEPEAIELLPEKLARKNIALPVSVDRRSITVAMADPLDFDAISDITFATSKEVRPTIAPFKEIKAAIRRFYHLSHPLQKILGEIQGGALEVIPQQETMNDAEAMEEVVRKGESAPIIRLVNGVIVHAARNKASDIHFEPWEKTVKVRERVDGLLMEAFEFPKLVQGAVTSRIKIMGRMDIAEKNIPQDGRIRVKVEGRDLDLRVSTLPSYFGEKITIRLLDSQAAALRLSEIGPVEKDYLRIRNIIERPQGIILITGPTGSGKTSTQYAMIHHIRNGAINIITLEDPVEYELNGVTQVAINEKTGLTFAFALRSVLRQDPDVIMVGEMRDAETAKIAVEASLTGHLVVTTLHTNTAVAAITRLKNLGIPPYLIASSLNGVVAQRLVRKICTRCKELYTPGEEEWVKLRGRGPTGVSQLYRGAGCPACNQTGYRGRTGVFEVFVLDSAIRELIAGDAPEEAILKAALERGMRYMSDDGMEKVFQGVTTVQELFRVVYVSPEEIVLYCPRCGGPVRKREQSCPSCGLPPLGSCPECRQAREPRWKYCPYCGERYPPLVPTPVEERAAG